MKPILAALILTLSTSAFAGIDCAQGTNAEDARSIREVSGGLEVVLGSTSFVVPTPKVQVIRGKNYDGLENAKVLIVNKASVEVTRPEENSLEVASVIFVYNPISNQGLLTLIMNGATIERNTLMRTCKK